MNETKQKYDSYLDSYLEDVKKIADRIKHNNVAIAIIFGLSIIFSPLIMGTAVLVIGSLLIIVGSALFDLFLTVLLGLLGVILYSPFYFFPKLWQLLTGSR